MHFGWAESSATSQYAGQAIQSKYTVTSSKVGSVFFVKCETLALKKPRYDWQFCTTYAGNPYAPGDASQKNISPVSFLLKAFRWKLIVKISWKVPLSGWKFVRNQIIHIINHSSIDHSTGCHLATWQACTKGQRSLLLPLICASLFNN